MSYADCFAAALAKINKAELITGIGNLRKWKGSEGGLAVSTFIKI